MPALAFRIVKISSQGNNYTKVFRLLCRSAKKYTIFFGIYFPLPANGCMHTSALAHKSGISQVKTHAH